jgi:PAS domain S-box-containing protein
VPAGGVRPRPGDVVAALERLPVPTWTIGLDRTVTWMNPAARELMGDLVGQRVPVGFAPESEKVAMDAYARKLLGGAESTEYEAVMLDRHGQRFVAEVSSVRLETDGHVMGVFGQVRPERTLPPVRTNELTPRQGEVLRYLAEGGSTTHMAELMGVSVETVRNHIRDLLKRLGVHSRLEAVITARERGLI